MQKNELKGRKKSQYMESHDQEMKSSINHPKDINNGGGSIQSQSLKMQKSTVKVKEEDTTFNGSALSRQSQ
jgi:hypothetical protein